MPSPSSVVTTLASLTVVDRRHAAAHGLAVHQHRAGAALAQAAAVFGPLQSQVVAQHVEQRRVGVDFGRQVRAVHVELKRAMWSSLVRDALLDWRTRLTLHRQLVTCTASTQRQRPAEADPGGHRGRPYKAAASHQRVGHTLWVPASFVLSRLF